jgi:hypothetical protein
MNIVCNVSKEKFDEVSSESFIFWFGQFGSITFMDPNERIMTMNVERMVACDNRMGALIRDVFPGLGTEKDDVPIILMRCGQTTRKGVMADFCSLLDFIIDYPKSKKYLGPNLCVKDCSECKYHHQLFMSTVGDQG